MTRRLVAVLAVTTTVGYGALIQAFSVLLLPISSDLGLSRTAVAAAGTTSVLVGAAAAIPVGRLLDRYGGRTLMTVGSVFGVASVALWSQADSALTLYLAFAGIGLALAMSTYEAAFAVLVAATDARRRVDAILAVTMITGVATSLYYPLTGWLETQLGWRAAVGLLALSLAVIAVPAHALALPGQSAHQAQRRQRGGVGLRAAVRDGRFWLLGLAFVGQSAAVSAFLLLVLTHLRDVGHSMAVASTLVALVGVMQVLSRLALRPLARRFGIAGVAAAAFTIQAVGLLLMPVLGASAVWAGACIAAVGIGNGISVVAKPSIVSAIFGVASFATIFGVLTVPIALARAAAPLGAAWLADWRWLALAGGLTLLSAAALLPLSVPRRRYASSPATSEPATTSA